MSCPFAKFASLFPNTTKHDSPYHSDQPSFSSSSSSLSEALRLGTAASHRAVEKSLGVSLLLSSLSPSSSTSVEGRQSLSFERIDYVRFNVMLACIYVALEASVRSGRDEELMKPLFRDAGLMESLARSQGLLDDISAHLKTIELHTGANLGELAEAAREENSITSQTAVVREDMDNEQSRTELLRLVQDALPSALLLNPTPTESIQGLTEDHISLLTPAQTNATLAYVSTLLNLPRTSNAGLLLSHAYTRYLGDLSGGQHIVRKLAKRLATEEGDGFKFYSFSTSSSPTGADLKTRFRTAMESTTPTSQTTLRLVTEANRAFDLNTGLFESLLPAELRMQPEPPSTFTTEKDAGGELVDIDVKGKQKGQAWMMVALACAAGVLWTTHSLLVMRRGMVADGVVA